MYQVTVQKVESTHDNLRTDEVVGEILDLPKVGDPLQVFASALDLEFGVRVVTTTPIQKIRGIGEDELVVYTENSMYVLKNIIPLEELF